MFGEDILARSMTATARVDEYGNRWQYHPRSDAHSKVICWAILFDLLNECCLFRAHASRGLIGFGINHEMRDYRMNRRKNLDMVVCLPVAGAVASGSFRQTRERLGIVLTPAEESCLATLPDLPVMPVSTALVALEAKACMTEHLKARPRLYDELSSSFQTILGDTRSAIAAAFVAINVAPFFVSPLRNRRRITVKRPAATTAHDQPRVARLVFEKVMELPRRAADDGFGYDAIGVSLIDCRNDGSPVQVLRTPAGGFPVDPIPYRALIGRLAAIYASRFRSLG